MIQGALEANAIDRLNEFQDKAEWVMELRVKVAAIVAYYSKSIQTGTISSRGAKDRASRPDSATSSRQDFCLVLNNGMEVGHSFSPEKCSVGHNSGPDGPVEMVAECSSIIMVGVVKQMEKMMDVRCC